MSGATASVCSAGSRSSKGRPPDHPRRPTPRSGPPPPVYTVSIRFTVTAFHFMDPVNVARGWRVRYTFYGTLKLFRRRITILRAAPHAHIISRAERSEVQSPQLRGRPRLYYPLAQVA